MKIITIGREFGSGGRELGKRLADHLGIPCYDKEIIIEAAKLQKISPEYVERISEKDIRVIYPMTIGRRFTSPSDMNTTAINALVSLHNVIRKLAEQGDCVIIGRNADVILADMKTCNLFVYASEQAKLHRCMQRAENGESEKEILKQMKKIDKGRAANRTIISSTDWGKRENYHLCINTSDMNFKALVPVLAEYVKVWFDNAE